MFWDVCEEVRGQLAGGDFLLHHWVPRVETSKAVGLSSRCLYP